MQRERTRFGVRGPAGEAGARGVRASGGGAALGGAVALLAVLLAVQVAQGGQAGLLLGPRVGLAVGFGAGAGAERAEIRKLSAEIVRAFRGAPETEKPKAAWGGLVGWAKSRDVRERGNPGPRRPSDEPAARDGLLVRVALVNLPPPAC